MFGKALGDMRTLKVRVLWFPLPTMLFSTSFGGNKDVNGNAIMPKWFGRSYENNGVVDGAVKPQIYLFFHHTPVGV